MINKHGCFSAGYSDAKCLDAKNAWYLDAEGVECLYAEGAEWEEYSCVDGAGCSSKEGVAAILYVDDMFLTGT